MFNYTNAQEVYDKYHRFHDYVIESFAFDAFRKTVRIEIKGGLLNSQKFVLTFVCVEGFEYVGGDSWGKEANGRIIELNVEKATNSKIYLRLNEQTEKYNFSCVDLTKITEVTMQISTGNVISILCDGFNVAQEFPKPIENTFE